MFVWAECPDGDDMEAIYREAVLRNIAFVPGDCFYVSGAGGGAAMRLNFTMPEEAEIEKAVKILGEVLTF